MTMISKEVLETIQAKADAYDAFSTPEHAALVLETLRTLEGVRDLMAVLRDMLRAEDVDLPPQWRERLAALLAGKGVL